MSDLPAGASLHVSELLTLQVLVQVAAAEALALRDLDSTPPIGDDLLSYRMAGELFIVGRDAIRAAMPASSEDLVRIAGRAMLTIVTGLLFSKRQAIGWHRRVGMRGWAPMWWSRLTK